MIFEGKELVFPVENVDIQKLLPHAHPFLLVDKILGYKEEEDTLIGLKNVTFSENFFQGHFKDNPIMPGVLIIESLAQVAGILAIYKSGVNRPVDTLYYFAQINNARFNKQVLPGDSLHLEVQHIQAKRGFIKFNAQAKVNNSVVASAELMLVRRSNSNNE